MNETEYIKILNFPKVTRVFIKSILTYGRITGSQVFGGVSEYSDIDIIIPDTQLNVHDALTDGCIYLTDYKDGELYTSLYAHSHDNKIYNILIMHNKEIYFRWANATILLQNMLKNNKQLRPLVKHKANRIQLFETLKDIIARRHHEQS